MMYSSIICIFYFYDFIIFKQPKITTMIDDLFKFYKDNLTFESAVIRKNGFLKNGVFYLLICAYICFGISFMITHNWFFGIIAIIIIVTSVIWGRVINVLLIKAKYPAFWSSWISWSNSEFNKMFLDRLEDYLKDKDDNKLDKIQELIKERVNRAKYPSIVFISTFAGLFIPLWSSFINAIMDSMKKNGIEMMGFVFLIFSLLIISVSFNSPMFAELRDNLITQYMKWNQLNDLISDMRLRRK